jgi:hypothetical protein
LLTHYDLLRRKPPQSLQEKLWRAARQWLAAAKLRPPHVTKYPWLPGLKHAATTEHAKVLLIWAFGAQRDELRRACEGFTQRLKGQNDFVPVLVTNVADFAWFSRLGWLVEYLPELGGKGRSYQERKRAYLAWRYRDANIVPMSAGLASEGEWQVLLEMRN